MLRIALLLALAANLVGCKSNEWTPVIDPQIPNSPIVWKKLLSGSPASALNSAPHYYGGNIIVGKKETSGYTVTARNAENGDSLWKTTIQTHNAFNPLDGEETFLYEDKLVFSSALTLFVLDANTGDLLWKSITENMRGGSCVIDGYIYKSDYVNRTSSTMYRFGINSGQKEEIFTIKHGINEPGRDFTPFLNLPVKWIAPSGDEILVLQNRSYGYDKIGPDGMYGYSKMDLMAYNLTADSILWYRYEVDNFSSQSRPALDGDKVYFFGDRHVYCINALNGETIWKYFIGDGPEDDFNTANILIVEDKLIVKPDNDDMHAVNKETGERIWLNTNTATMPGLLTVHQDIIWFSSGGILAVDANSGQTIIDQWNNNDLGSWIFPIAHHPSSNLIYTSDGSSFFCLEPQNMR